MWGNNWKLIGEVFKETSSLIQTQIGVPGFLIGSMAVVTVLGQDRFNIARKVHFLGSADAKVRANHGDQKDRCNRPTIHRYPTQIQ